MNSGIKSTSPYVDTENTYKDDKSDRFDKASMKKSIVSKSSKFSAKSSSALEFSEMKNVFDLLEQFAEANRMVLQTKKNSSKLFLEFTELLEQILDLSNNIIINIDLDHFDELDEI